MDKSMELRTPNDILQALTDGQRLRFLAHKQGETCGSAMPVCGGAARPSAGGAYACADKAADAATPQAGVDQPHGQRLRFLVCAHVNPDGDTLGASLALRMALMRLGHEVTVVCEHAVPTLYAFLPGAESVCTPGQAQGAYDIAIAVDVSDYARLGNTAPLYDAAPVRLVIDHHPTNDRFGQVNWIAPDASATGLLVQQLITDLGVELTQDIATCLYVAVSTDTGHFQFGNTTGDAMRAAATLMEAGVDVSDVSRKLYRTRQRASVELLARGLSSMTFSPDGRVAGCTLTRQDILDTGAGEGDSEGIVNYGIEIVGVQAAYMARENGDGVKCSLRAIAPYDVGALAKRLGGGGHARAAGCTLAMPLADAAAFLRVQLCAMLRGE